VAILPRNIGDGMNRLFFPLVLTAVTALLLAACGGGSAGSGAGTPVPTGPLTIHGEAVAFHGGTPATLQHPATSVSAVYSYDSGGHRVDYEASADYTFASGAIARTAASRIPDFDTYSYTAVNAAGQFAFSEGPPRNPPLTISMMTYVDYASTVLDTQIEPAAAGKSYARVMCVGDSITAGADTISSFYSNSDADSYCGLLRAYTGAHIDNVSVVGGTLAAALPGLPQELASSTPEVVILAFGMNDHTAGVAGLAAFSATLDAAVTTLQDAGVDVILMGFLQQNRLWVLEDPTQTEAYNAAIAAIAQARGVPFVDPRPRFGDGDLPSIERLTADFMHHPNQYGQRLYFSLLLPYFLSQPVPVSSVSSYVL
jgi:lysophospholipase L1-like esterase